MQHPEENLTAYASGQLTGDEAQKVEQHLKACESCRKELHRLRQLDLLLSSVGDIEPSPRFMQGVWNRIQQDQKVIAFRSRRKLSWVALAAVIAFFVFVLAVNRWPHSPEVAHQTQPQQHKVAKPTPPAPLPQPQNQPSAPETVTPEDAELIANLDIIENMDVIQNYDDVENLDVALLNSSPEKPQ